MSYFSTSSADGTSISCWTNHGTGLPVVISNGLGAPVESWDQITKDRDAYRVASWDYRGLGRSARPADESRITVADHADDLIATMDVSGMDEAVIVGWSVGVNVAFEVAQRCPERVLGIMAVAGVPGATFSSLFHPMPRHLRVPAGQAAVDLVKHAGPSLSLLTALLPAKPGGISTFWLDVTHLSTLWHSLQTFAGHDWDWYSKLVLAAGQHRAMDVSAVTVPTSFIGGQYDAICSADDIRAVSRRVQGSRYLELPSTHYVPLQFPEALAGELRALASRVTAPPS